jgi:hypothetical protein
MNLNFNREKKAIMNKFFPLSITISLIMCGVALFGDPMAPQKITIGKKDGKWRAAGPSMEAVIDLDGTMSRLRFPFPGEYWDHVPNYLKTGIGLPKERNSGGSRGAFFLQNGEILTLPDIKQKGENTIIAQSPEAKVEYEFTDKNQILTVTNKTKKPMQYLLVLEPSVYALYNPEAGYKEAPVNEFWEEVTCFQGKRKLNIKGLSRLWGPGPLIGQNWRKGFFQVCEVTLKPEESRKIILTPSIATKEEIATVNGIAQPVRPRGVGPRQMVSPQPAIKGNLKVLSPREYQVFQRQSKFSGKIYVAGRIAPECDKLEISITGKSLKGELDGKWQDIPLEKIRRTFASSVPVCAGGWYKVKLRATLNGKKVAEAVLDHVGVGEVFVGCGQSNSTNCGDLPTKTETGMVSTFSGSDWRLANDPQPGTHDNSQRGSFWPSFGDAIYLKYKVPVGVAATGRGGAPVSNWRLGSPSFIWFMTRILELGKGGFRAVIWHQGESDARRCTADYYFENLSSTIKGSHAVAGWDFPWFVPLVSYNNPKATSFPQIREGQKRLWKAGFALEGPDTDTLQGDNRAGIHFSTKGLKKHGQLWAEKVSVYLDKVLAE